MNQNGRSPIFEALFSSILQYFNRKMFETIYVASSIISANWNVFIILTFVSNNEHLPFHLQPAETFQIHYVLLRCFKKYVVICNRDPLMRNEPLFILGISFRDSAVLMGTTAYTTLLTRPILSFWYFESKGVNSWESLGEENLRERRSRIYFHSRSSQSGKGFTVLPNGSYKVL